MKKKNKLVDRRYLVPFILITSLFFLWGFARAILDVLNKHFQDELHISITQSSLIQVTTYLGYFLMAIPAGMFINRYGYRKGVIFGLSIFGLGALSMPIWCPFLSLVADLSYWKLLPIPTPPSLAPSQRLRAASTFPKLSMVWGASWQHFLLGSIYFVPMVEAAM